MLTVYFFEIPLCCKSLPAPVLRSFRSEQGENNQKALPSFIGKAIAKTAAGKISGVSPEEIVILKAPSGKPYFRDLKQLEFNISHTKSAVAVAVGSRAIGVDIEKLKKPDFKVAERYFTEDERQYLAKAEDKSTAFFEIWTAKEAYFKYKGTGLGAGLSTTSVLKKEIAEKIKALTLGDYIISVCSEDTQSPRLIEADEKFWG